MAPTTKFTPLDDAIVIAVMGATGTGKSTFINLVSDGDLDIGDGLRPRTTEVRYSHMFDLDGRKVILVDTPGFDDITKSDTDVLKMIALHLSQTYGVGVALSGVIYMHRITDFRVGGVHQRNFPLFRKLCAEDTLRNVLIVTSMWGLLADPSYGNKREHELKTEDMLFKPVLDKGARMVRHGGSLGDARDIIREIIRNHPKPLKIQMRHAGEGECTSKISTSAGPGDELLMVLGELMKRHRAEKHALEELVESLKAKVEELREEVQEVKTDLMRKHRTEMAVLKEEMEDAMRTRDEEMRRELEEVKADVMRKLMRSLK